MGINAPISIRNLITNQMWGYPTIASLLGGNSGFTFAPFPPGVYEVINGTSSSFSVATPGPSYTIFPGEVWVFYPTPDFGGAQGQKGIRTSAPYVATATNWNPSDLSNVTLSGGNLVATGTAGGGVRSVGSNSTGKYYWEYTYTTVTTNNLGVGIALATASLATPTTGSAYVARSNGNIMINGSASGSSVSGGTAITTGSVLCFAVDFTSQLLWIRQNAGGNWNGSGAANPATAAGGLSISSIAGSLFAFMTCAASDVVTANFGGSAFTGAVPAGFVSGFLA